MLVLHHLRKRRKSAKRNEFEMEILDYIVYAASILGPLMTIPQILVIWNTKTAAGVSIISWLGFVIYNSIWLTYGIVRKDPPIILSNFLWVLLQITVVVGAIIYR